MQQQILLEEGIVEIISFQSTLVNGLYSLKFSAKNNKNLITPIIEINTNI